MNECTCVLCVKGVIYIHIYSGHIVLCVCVCVCVINCLLILILIQDSAYILENVYVYFMGDVPHHPLPIYQII
jgi:hypothetical protein